MPRKSATSSAAPSAVQPSKDQPPVCLVDLCNRPAHTRGVCCSCYVHARVLVNTGETSWKELESFGLVLPAHKAAPKNPLKAAFLAVIEKKGKRLKIAK